MRDIFGGSDGFRRPGYAVSIEPGLLFAVKDHTVSVSLPVALQRNRLRSTSDIKDNTWGDAAFADHLWQFGISKRF